MPHHKGAKRAPTLQAVDSIALFSLASGRILLERICDQLRISPSRHEERDFPDGEHEIRLLDSVLGRDAYLIESLHGDGQRSVDERLIRVLFFLGTLADAGALRVTLIAPYLCYSRKDARTQPRDSLSTRYLAALLEAVGTQRIVAVEVHNPSAFENAFRIPTEHLPAEPVLVNACVPLLRDLAVVVVSPDVGGAKRAERFRQLLERRLARQVGVAFVEKFRNESGVYGRSLAGDVRGRAALIVDDLISSGTTVARAAAICREHGATATYAAAAHAVFSADAGRVLADSALERILVLNTVSGSREPAGLPRDRIQVLDCSRLLAAALQRLHGQPPLAGLIEVGS
jgi:ribose-phosphate pyrophosphokinase